MAVTISNPFTAPVTESIRSTAEFIELFEPSILARIDWRILFSVPLTYLLSAEGAGKSTILRVMSPGILLDAARRQPDDPLRHTLERIGAVSDGRVTKIGIHTKSTISFGYISNLDAEQSTKRRLFFALLNARVAIRFARSLCDLHEVAFPVGLSRYSYDYGHAFDGCPSELAQAGTATDFYDWARRVEVACLRAIDAVRASGGAAGDEAFVAPRLVDPQFWTRDGKPLNESAVVMLDDAQDLTIEQREWIAQSVTKEREGARVWIAMRTHALDLPDVFLGAQENRDFVRLRLESLWKEAGAKQSKQSSGIDTAAVREFMRRVAQRRLAASQSRRIRDLSELVQDTLDSRDHPELAEMYNRVLARIRTRVRDNGRYNSWIESVLKLDDTWNQLVTLREIEIMIERDLSTSRPITDQAYTTSVLEARRAKAGGSARLAAEALLSYESSQGRSSPRVPLYFGGDDLAQLGSLNTQQFLRVCRGMFDLALDAELRQAPKVEVSARTQDIVIRQIAEERWKHIATSLRRGPQIQALVSAMASRLLQEFTRSTAPYAPAPVGLSIPREEYAALCEGVPAIGEYADLREVLADCLANNVLYVDDRHHHSAPHKVFYLNSLVLVHFSLPIKSRQFQATSLQQLEDWRKNGFRATKIPRSSQARRRPNTKKAAYRDPTAPRLADFDDGGESPDG